MGLHILEEVASQILKMEFYNDKVEFYNDIFHCHDYNSTGSTTANNAVIVVQHRGCKRPLLSCGTDNVKGQRKKTG